MPFPSKVDPVRLQVLLKSGLSQNEIARQLGVNKGSISKRVKSLPSSGDVGLIAANEVGKHIPALKRLDKISKIIEGELELIQEAIKATAGGERRAWLKTQIEHSAEIRKQLGLLREISLTLYNVQQLEVFRKTVLDVIGECDAELRDKVIAALERKRSVEHALGSGGHTL
jgi:hypothetical protein